MSHHQQRGLPHQPQQREDDEIASGRWQDDQQWNRTEIARVLGHSPNDERFERQGDHRSHTPSSSPYDEQRQLENHVDPYQDGQAF